MVCCCLQPSRFSAHHEMIITFVSVTTLKHKLVLDWHRPTTNLLTWIFCFLQLIADHGMPSISFATGGEGVSKPVDIA